MTERDYSKRVQRALDALPPAALAAALDQLVFTKGEDEQLTVVTDSFIHVAAGSDATAAVRCIRSERKRERKDMRRAGSALDVTTASDVGLVSEQDPCSTAIAAEAFYLYQASAIKAGWSRAAAPATIGLEPALSVVLAARGCRCGLRTVQNKMRDICRAERDGQGVLPGVPLARDVYTTRALGVGA